MENITENTLDKEVAKRIRKRFFRAKTRLVWITIFNIIGFIALYIFLLGMRGFQFAIENIVLALASVLAVDTIGFLGTLAYLFFYEIPEKIYLEQKKIIDERLPNELSLEIQRAANILTRDGKDIIVTALLITNLEKKKIVEFQALVNFQHFYYVKDHDYVRQSRYEINKPLYWVGEGQEPNKTEIELRPNIRKILVVAELQDGKTEDGQDVRLALICSNPIITSIEFAEESIYQIKIRFQGKLEGEFDFRTFHYETIFYTKPDTKRMLFLSVAEKAYPDIPKKLLDRSKDIIKYMTNIKNDKVAQ